MSTRERDVIWRLARRYLAARTQKENSLNRLRKRL